MNYGKLGMVKQEIARFNIDILWNSDLKWMGIREFNSNDHDLPFMVTSFIWGQCPVFSHPEFPQDSPKEWLQFDDC